MKSIFMKSISMKSISTKSIPFIKNEHQLGFFVNIRTLFNSSIKYRLLLFLILFTLIPLMILGAVSYSISKTTIDHKVRDYSERLIKQTAENVDFRLSTYQDTLIQIITNPDIISLLRNIDQTPAVGKRLDSLTLTTKLAYYVATAQEFKTVSFISRNHYIKGIWWTRDIDNGAAFYRKTVRGGNDFQWFSTRRADFSDSVGSSGENVFSVAKQIFDLRDGNSLDIVALFDIRETVLAAICKDSVAGLPIESFMIDGKGMIIADPDQKLIFRNIGERIPPQDLRKIYAAHTSVTSFPSRYQKRQVLINVIQLTGNNWRIINVIDNSYLYRESNRVIQIIVIMAVVCIVLAVLAAFFIARSITTPLQQIIQTMKQVVSGNLAARIATGPGSGYGKDEFLLLQDNFNYMIAQIEELIKKVYQEQNSKRIAEVKALQMQINPHFLYNTLDTIKWTALIQKANNAAEMANLLSRLLHISLGKGEETVSVANEIEHVRCYLGIQKFRFNFNIEIGFSVAEDTLALKTPKLILQPIVENALLHGLAEKSDGGSIMITGSRVEERLKFEISDNGCGITPEEMDDLMESKRKSGEIFSGIGISNVNERIKLICGPEYGIKIFSQPGRGTKVEIWLPILE